MFADAIDDKVATGGKRRSPRRSPPPPPLHCPVHLPLPRAVDPGPVRSVMHSKSAGVRREGGQGVQRVLLKSLPLQNTSAGRLHSAIASQRSVEGRHAMCRAIAATPIPQQGCLRPGPWSGLLGLPTSRGMLVLRNANHCWRHNASPSVSKPFSLKTRERVSEMRAGIRMSLYDEEVLIVRVQSHSVFGQSK